MSKTGTIDLTGAFTKSLVAKLDKVERQRDELLIALKLVTDELSGRWLDDLDCVKQARRAIAEVEKS